MILHKHMKPIKMVKDRDPIPKKLPQHTVEINNSTRRAFKHSRWTDIAL
jgi:hypothetical protein